MTLKSRKNRLIIASQRSQSTYCLQLHERAYHCLSEPWDPASQDWGREWPQDQPLCVKTHAREIMSSADRVRDEWPDIWILQRRDRSAQILSLALARATDRWFVTPDMPSVRLTHSEVESARDSIDQQSQFLAEFPADHHVWREDLTGDVSQDSDLWLIAPQHQLDRPPSLPMPATQDRIINWHQCVNWL